MKIFLRLAAVAFLSCGVPTQILGGSAGRGLG